MNSTSRKRQAPEIVAVLSHEIKGLLAPIEGWARTLLSVGDNVDATVRSEGLRSILRASLRLERLAGNLLQQAKLEQGLETPHLQRLSLRRIVEETVADFRITEPSRVIDVTAEIDDDTIVADDLWVARILGNLLSNSLKYSARGSPVSVRLEGEELWISASVGDRGPGIPAQDVEKIFRPFERLEERRDASEAGAGLGLYVARALALTMNGDMRVTSIPGQGSTFTVVLPRARRSISGNPAGRSPDPQRRTRTIKGNLS